MKQLFNKLGAKAEKQDKGHDPEREAAKAIEDARRQAASRHGGPPGQSTSATGLGRRPPPDPEPPTFVEREPREPAAPPPGSKFTERPPAAPPMSPPGGPMGGFGAPGGGTSATPDEERRAITDMALEDLRARRTPSPDDTPPRLPADELERRRPPSPGESLPGVPPPHIPAEDLRDQALQEILDRKERLDREYRERQARESGEPVRPARKGKLHGLAKKKLAAAAPPAARADAAPEPAAPATPEPPAVQASRPAPIKRPLKKKLRAKAATSPAAASPPEPPTAPEQPPAVGASTTTGETPEEALAAIKGVGPVIRGALLERFESVEAIREADADELTEVEGVGPALAKRIKTSL